MQPVTNALSFRSFSHPVSADTPLTEQENMALKAEIEWWKRRVMALESQVTGLADELADAEAENEKLRALIANGKK